MNNNESKNSEFLAYYLVSAWLSFMVTGLLMILGYELKRTWSKKSGTEQTREKALESLKKNLHPLNNELIKEQSDAASHSNNSIPLSIEAQETLREAKSPDAKNSRKKIQSVTHSTISPKKSKTSKEKIYQVKADRIKKPKRPNTVNNPIENVVTVIVQSSVTENNSHPMLITDAAPSQTRTKNKHKVQVEDIVQNKNIPQPKTSARVIANAQPATANTQVITNIQPENSRPTIPFEIVVEHVSTKLLNSDQQAKPELPLSSQIPGPITNEWTQQLTTLKKLERDLINHAIQISNFSYDSSLAFKASLYPNLIKDLSFLFHVHRYNLLILYFTKMQNQSSAHVRNLIVHIANKTQFSQQDILDTQAQMKIGMSSQIALLLPETIHFKEFEHLVKCTGNEPDPTKIIALDKLALSTLFSYEYENIKNQYTVSSNNLYSWLKDTILPSFNHLYNFSQTNLLTYAEKEEYTAAIEMLVIIIGEYCSSKYRKPLQYCRELAQVEKEELASLVTLMQLARVQRNDLAHIVSPFDIDRLNELFEKTNMFGHTMPAKIQLGPVCEDIITAIDNNDYMGQDNGNIHAQPNLATKEKKQMNPDSIFIPRNLTLFNSAANKTIPPYQPPMTVANSIHTSAIKNAVTDKELNPAIAPKPYRPPVLEKAIAEQVALKRFGVG